MAPDANIRSRVQEITKKGVVAPPSVTSAFSLPKINFNTSILAIAILFLALSTLTVFVVKKQSSVVNKSEKAPEKVIERIKEHVAPANMATKQDVAELGHKLNERMDKAEKRITTWGNRVWLLGIAHNENINIMRADEFKRHGTQADYIVFDGQWKINHLPNTMDIEDLKDDLQKNVK